MWGNDLLWNIASRQRQLSGPVVTHHCRSVVVEYQGDLCQTCLPAAIQLCENLRQAALTLGEKEGRIGPFVPTKGPSHRIPPGESPKCSGKSAPFLFSA